MTDCDTNKVRKWIKSSWKFQQEMHRLFSNRIWDELDEKSLDENVKFCFSICFGSDFESNDIHNNNFCKVKNAIKKWYAKNNRLDASKHCITYVFVNVKMISTNDNAIFCVFVLNDGQSLTNGNWIDHECRLYKSWSDYLKKNTLPQCYMMYPAGGMYAQSETIKKYANVEVEKSISCTGSIAKKITQIGSVTAIIGGGALLATAIPNVTFAGLSSTAVGIATAGAMACKSLFSKSLSQAKGECASSQLNSVDICQHLYLLSSLFHVKYAIMKWKSHTISIADVHPIQQLLRIECNLSASEELLMNFLKHLSSKSDIDIENAFIHQSKMNFNRVKPVKILKYLTDLQDHFFQNYDIQYIDNARKKEHLLRVLRFMAEENYEALVATDNSNAILKTFEIYENRLVELLKPIYSKKMKDYDSSGRFIDFCKLLNFAFTDKMATYYSDYFYYNLFNKNITIQRYLEEEKKVPAGSKLFEYIVNSFINNLESELNTVMDDCTFISNCMYQVEYDGSVQSLAKE